MTIDKWIPRRIVDSVVKCGATEVVGWRVEQRVREQLKGGETAKEIRGLVELALCQADAWAGRSYILKGFTKQRQQITADPNMIADFIHHAKYARWTGERRETWDETVDRVVAMHVKRYPGLRNEINEAFQAVREHKVLPSMRSMQFAGVAIERHNERMYNCSFTLLDRPCFHQIFYLLLCGCGVGYSVQRQHVAKLPFVVGGRCVVSAVETAIDAEV